MTSSTSMLRHMAKTIKHAKSYKLRDARSNFSYLIKTVGKESGAYIIKDHDTPKAVLIDIETAETYLPGNYLEVLDKKSKRNWVDLIKGWEKQQPKPKKLENISGNVDKILYGI